MVGNGRSSLPVISRCRSLTNLMPAPDARFAESPYLNFCGQAFGSAKTAQPPRQADRTHADNNRHNAHDSPLTQLRPTQLTHHILAAVSSPIFSSVLPSSQLFDHRWLLSSDYFGVAAVTTVNLWLNVLRTCCRNFRSTRHCTHGCPIGGRGHRSGLDRIR